MPGEAGAELIGVGRIAGHSEVILIGCHKEAVYMLVLEEEPQVDGADEEVRIHIHPGVVADEGCLLGSEGAGSGAEDRRVIAREVSQVHADLGIEGPEPGAVIIEPVLKDDGRHRQDGIVGGMLDDGMVLEVDPGGSEVECDIAGDDLDAALVLARFPVGSREVYGSGYVFEREVDAGFEPLRGVRDGSSAEEAIGVFEIIRPDDMVGAIVLEVRMRRDGLGVSACTDDERCGSGLELGFESSVDIKFSDLIAQEADGALDIVADV